MTVLPTDLSIILVSYNSKADLERCLPTIAAQSDSLPVEVIVVDNHGADGVADWLPVAYPHVRFIRNPQNTGYAGGNNMGAETASGKWLFFLNPDTELKPDCLSQLLATARQFPEALLNPKILNPDGTVNACGNQMHYTGITTCRGLNEPSDNYQILEPVSLLSGAALLVPAAIFRELQGFDEAYFMYFEDADLSMRARLAGYSLLCEERAVLTHYYTLGMNARKFFFLERNRLLTFLKVFSPSAFRRLLPGLLITELLTWVFALRGLDYLKSRIQTYKWLIRNRSEIRRSRHMVQKTRRVSDASLLAESSTTLPFDQLMSGTPGRLANAVLEPLFRLLRPRLK